MCPRVSAVLRHSTCALSSGTLFYLQPLLNPRKGPRSTPGVMLARPAERGHPCGLLSSASLQLHSVHSSFFLSSPSFTITWSLGNTYCPPSNLNYNKQPAFSFQWLLTYQRKEENFVFLSRVLLVPFFFLSFSFFLNIASCLSSSLIPFKINLSSGFICNHQKNFHFILVRIFYWMSQKQLPLKSNK